MKKAIALAFALCAASAVSQYARGAPPPADSDDYKILSPYSDAVKDMKIPDTQAMCCSLSDCRPVEWKIKSDGASAHYEVFINKINEKGSGFEDGPNAWIPVPDSVVIPPEKRDGLPVPVACWIKQRIVDNGFLCFTPGSGS